MTRVQAAALACAMSSALLGCAEPWDERATAAARAAIIDGEPSGASEDGVVLIRVVLEGEREEICSASLVGPNLVATARHCVSYLQEGLFSCSVSGELTSSVDGAGRIGLHFPAEAIEVYAGELPRRTPLARGRQILSTLSETICRNDLAFVVLDKALDLPLVPMRLGRPARFGEAAVLVGYGLQRGQNELSYETQPRMRKAGLSISGVGPDLLDDGVTTAAPRALLIDGASGCVGDSGGPLLAEATGALLGVYSLQQGDSCGASNVRNHLVHVPPFERLIADAFAAAETEPLLEPEPSAVAGAGGDGGDASGGAGASAAANGGGQGGEGSDPEPNGRSTKRDASGCALSGEHERAPGAGAAFLILAVLWRRLSADRRADRRLWPALRAR
jgi:hypothetical protein